MLLWKLLLQSSKGSLLQLFSFKVLGRKQIEECQILFPILYLLFWCSQQDTRSDICIFSSRKHLVMSMVSFRTGNVSQALAHSSSLEESASMCLQEEPTEGASNHVVVTSEQNLEPAISVLPRHPSEDQKLYQDLLVINLNLIFCTAWKQQQHTAEVTTQYWHHRKLCAIFKLICYMLWKSSEFSGLLFEV